MISIEDLCKLLWAKKMPEQARRDITDSISLAWHVVYAHIQHCKYGELDVAYCPLCFKEPTEASICPYEIDSCATSLAISILTTRKDSLDAREKSIIKNCCKLLLKFREPSGGWPSIVSLSPSRIFDKIEGTINDTYYALDALTRAGLPNYSNDILELDVEEQLDILYGSIQWFLNNRLHNAWYYTELEFLDQEDLLMKRPAILPTTSVIVLFGKIAPILDEFNKKLDEHKSQQENISQLIERNKKLCEEIKEAFDKAIEWVIASQNRDGGYGEFPGSETRVTNSALVLKALLLDETVTSFECSKKILNRILQEDPASIEALSDEDVFERYDQIMVINEKGKKRTMRRQIIHEKFIEGILLQIIADSYGKKWQCNGKSLYEDLSIINKLRLKILMNHLIDQLIDLQEKTGHARGAFKARNFSLVYPEYAIFETITAFNKVLDYNIKFNIISKKKFLLVFFIFLSTILVILLIGNHFGLDIMYQIIIGIISNLAVIYIVYGTSLFKKAFKN